MYDQLSKMQKDISKKEFTEKYEKFIRYRSERLKGRNREVKEDKR